MAERVQEHTGTPVSDAIMSVATTLFAAKGFDGTSMREIAASAGVAKPTIYYYFKSKEGLLEHILDKSAASLFTSLAEINQRDNSADVRRCLEDTAWAFFKFAREHSDLLRFVHGCVFGSVSPVPSEAMHEAYDCMVAEVRRAVARAAESGLVRPDDVDEATMALRGMISVHVFDYLHNRVGKLARDTAVRLVDGFLYGCARREVR